jgi:prevent-host-death family protein
MRTYPLHEARAEFSKLADRALSGEPQRVTRHGKEAVVIVSEEQWSRRPRSAPTLGDFLVDFAERVGFDEDLFADRSWFKEEREPGADFLKDD